MYTKPLFFYSFAWPRDTGCLLAFPLFTLVWLYCLCVVVCGCSAIQQAQVCFIVACKFSKIYEMLHFLGTHFVVMAVFIFLQLYLFFMVPMISCLHLHVGFCTFLFLLRYQGTFVYSMKFMFS